MADGEVESLRAFRAGLFVCLGRRRDALLEVLDALLTAGPSRSPAGPTCSGRAPEAAGAILPREGTGGMRGRDRAVVAALAALAAAGAGLAGYLHAGAPAALVAVPGALEVLGAAGLLLGLSLLGLGALLLRRRRR